MHDGGLSRGVSSQEWLAVAAKDVQLPGCSDERLLVVSSVGARCYLAVLSFARRSVDCLAGTPAVQRQITTNSIDDNAVYCCVYGW